MSGLTLQTSRNADESGNGDSSGASSGAHGGAGIYTELPKLELKKFFGKAHRFQEFWDLFRVSVENNERLIPAIKLEHLTTQCECPAYQAIAGLELSDANYQIAVDILKGRFGQRQIILNSHIDALLKINAVKSGDVIELIELRIKLLSCYHRYK